ncbi:MAG TPA: YciI family protein [Candidatus Methylacidiphilales bacterium]|nr:YciI family protein [Candidatus Methylacidiphilales bacterium]
MNTETQNQYLLLFRGAEWYTNASPEEIQAAVAKFKAWFESLNAKGIVRGAQPLVREGKIVSGKNGSIVADGPFAESKETIGGYFLLAVESLEEAVAVAKASPALEYGTQIEVRPVAEECPLMARARELTPDLALATA